MRPVNRGEWPKAADGNNIPFADYSAARDDLIRRIGDYCSYCEVCLHSSIAVEHVRPKKPPPERERFSSEFQGESIHGLDADQILLSDFFGLKTTIAPAKRRQLDEITDRIRSGDRNAPHRLIREMSSGTEEE